MPRYVVCNVHMYYVLNKINVPCISQPNIYTVALMSTIFFIFCNCIMFPHNFSLDNYNTIKYISIYKNSESKHKY